MNKVKRALLLVGWYLVGFAVPVCAQDEPQGPPLRGPAAERIEGLKKIRLLEVLKLDDETSIRFFNRYNNYQQNVREFQQQRQQALRALENLRKTDASDAELEKGIQEIRSVDAKFFEIRDQHWSDVREILSLKQFASYVVFENNFQRYLRELMRDVQHERSNRMQQRVR